MVKNLFFLCKNVLVHKGIYVPMTVSLSLCVVGCSCMFVFKSFNIYVRVVVLSMKRLGILFKGKECRKRERSTITRIIEEQITLLG